MDAVAALEARRSALGSSVVAARRDLRRAKAAEKAQARVWQVPASRRRSALIVYALAGYEAEPAVRYLEQVGRRRGWPTAAEEYLRSLVEGWFLGVDEHELSGWADAASPSDYAAMQDALPFVEEWRLVAWARSQNVEKGAVPSTSDLLDRLGQERLVAGRAAPYARGTTADGAARMWATRLRRRWGGHYGALPQTDELPLAEMRSKARAGGGSFIAYLMFGVV